MFKIHRRHFLSFPDFPFLLAGAAALEEIRPGVHGGAPVARAHAQHQELGLQDQQEGQILLKGQFVCVHVNTLALFILRQH